MLALRTIGDVAALGTATSAMSFLEFSDADVDSGRRASRGSHVETWNITRASEALPELVSTRARDCQPITACPLPAPSYGYWLAHSPATFCADPYALPPGCLPAPPCASLPAHLPACLLPACLGQAVIWVQVLRCQVVVV